MPTHAHLPDDIATLKAMILERDVALATQGEPVAQLREELSTRGIEIEHLKLLIAKLKRMQFGRKSEKLDHQIEQLELRLEDLQADESTVAMEELPSRKPRQSAPRKPLPAHLPRDEKIHLPEQNACPDCGGGLRQLGEDVAEQLDFIPASFRVIRHIRPKLACKCCDTILQAAAPSRPIARGLAGPRLLAHVLVSKYADHLPLYRQSVIYAREGVELDRGLLADWVGAASSLLRPLVDAIRRHVLAATKLHANDTPIPVLAPGNGKTKTARLWTYARDDRSSGSSEPAAVWFAYTPDRKGIHPQTHLASFTGVLQADAYAGFNAIYEGGQVVEAACWAHARRKFYDLHVARPSAVTTEALRRIGELYVIEAEIRGQPPDQRRAARQAQSLALIDDFETWLRATLLMLSRKSDTTAAIMYRLNLWPALKRYCDDGCIEIDNSAAERSLRGVAIGRRNYLFAGADSGGERAAAVYSLIGTAKLNGIDPEAWLRHVLTHIADHPVNQVHDFLPWNFTSTMAITR
ncbi:IS66 family transposase [Glaciimonas sp. CA11.2]|uniref:IS66 family transposase n=1 Tax=Glaciimonas sp. CA11.2 TaxID=3048601 RepID=UPI002AB38281|nr:IS66 family transposase [Glaciimonas sp. CA11.2]MDY7548205.1 IS66 family transposase [Glaciimonas sp. CA11.2]MEB0164363.1 IS66 family transposase [Glaciimonas sp. CA11.2]